MTAADFAGSGQIFNQTCTGVCYNDYVINNGTSQYSNAYFEVGYVRVYSGQASASGSGQTSASGSGQASASSGGRGREIAGSAIVFVALVMVFL